MVEFEYAKAVFELAKENNKIEEIIECFEAVLNTINPEFMEIITSPFINKDEKKNVIKKVYNSLDDDFVNFLYVLIDHNRFDKINGIFKEYESLVLKDKNILRVELTSAKALTKKKIEEFRKTLAMQYAGKTIEIVNKINPDLIGGVLIVADEESMDASVKGTLDKIRESL